LFKKYIILGGMPFLKYMNFEYEPSMQYLSDVYNSVVMKDIITYHKIREVDLLDRIIRYIMDNTGNTFSANSISKFFKNEGRKVAVDTIVNYRLFVSSSSFSWIVWTSSTLLTVISSESARFSSVQYARV